MAETPVSLLDRLREHPDAASWQRLVELYTPLIRSWLERYAPQPADADDLVQEVLAVLVRELPHFHHNRRPGAFRSWLRLITVNRLREQWAARRARPGALGGDEIQAVLEQLQDPDSGLTRRWDEEHDRHVTRRILELIEPEFEPATWQAFRRVVLDGAGTAAVATELGLTPNAVRIAKSRVLTRLRQESAGLID
jgi:RNA polymerase sigma-70 factor (ECF subfamily)